VAQASAPQETPVVVDAASEAVTGAVSEAVSDETSAAVFSSRLSRRDMRNLRERTANTTDIPVIRDEIFRIEPEEYGVGVSAPVEPLQDRNQDETIDSRPQTIAEATAATAIAESIASRQRTVDSGDIVIDFREDASDVTDDYEPFSISTMSTQSTGIIPTTGSALILPTLPENAPGARSSFNHTGEILITGSIMLPSGIGQFGADVLSLDTSEIDLISDDEEISSSQDLAPVRASSAVSAYNTSNTVVTVPSKLRDRLPLILAITAAGLAVGVVALFITGYVLGVF
jgi:hypothetical protein